MDMKPPKAWALDSMGTMQLRVKRHLHVSKLHGPKKVFPDAKMSWPPKEQR